MEKPASIAIKELREALIEDINKAGMPPVLLEMVLAPIYREIKQMAEEQIIEEEKAYNDKKGEKDNEKA